ncbi:MAG: hypothetical protein ACYC35_17025 [Pirellulales bacterium]
MIRPLLCVLVPALLVAGIYPVDAAIHVTVGDLALEPGAVGFVPVTITSDSSDLLDMFGVEFRITTLSGSSRLEFVDPPADPQLTDANYVFLLTDSGAVSLLPVPAGAISSSVLLTPNDTYIGGDGTLSLSGVTVPDTSSTPWKLLVSLQVTADTSAPPQIGDRFEISLVDDPLFTYFLRPDFTEIVFTSAAGEVAIVPEPLSCLIWGVGICAACLVGFRHRRKGMSQ